MSIHTILAFTCGHKSLDFEPTTPLCGLGTTICASQLPPVKEIVETCCDECLWSREDDELTYELNVEVPEVKFKYCCADYNLEVVDESVERDDLFQDFDSSFIFESDIEVLDQAIERDCSTLVFAECSDTRVGTVVA